MPCFRQVSRFGPFPTLKTAQDNLTPSSADLGFGMWRFVKICLFLLPLCPALGGWAEYFIQNHGLSHVRFQAWSSVTKNCGTCCIRYNLTTSLHKEVIGYNELQSESITELSFPASVTNEKRPSSACRVRACLNSGELYFAHLSWGKYVSHDVAYFLLWGWVTIVYTFFFSCSYEL